MAKRGRPCGFDREQALRRALDVFWEAGYEGVTMAALKEAMGGICAPSMYAAYGSKEALFRSAVELYLSQECQLSKGAFALPTARESIAALLESAAVSYTTEGKPRGCLVDLSTTNFSPANKGVEDYLRDHRRRAARCCASVSHEAWPTATCRPEPISTRSPVSTAACSRACRSRPATAPAASSCWPSAAARWRPGIPCWRSRPPDATARLDWKKPMDSPWAKTITRDIELIQTPGEVLPRVSRAPAIARCRLELS